MPMLMKLNKLVPPQAAQLSIHYQGQPVVLHLSEWWPVNGRTDEKKKREKASGTRTRDAWFQGAAVAEMFVKIKCCGQHQRYLIEDQEQAW